MGGTRCPRRNLRQFEIRRLFEIESRETELPGGQVFRMIHRIFESEKVAKTRFYWILITGSVFGRSGFDWTGLSNTKRVFSHG